MTCALHAQGRVRCVGYQLDEDSRWRWLPAPLDVAALEGASAIGFIEEDLCAERHGRVDCVRLGLARGFGNDPYGSK